MNSCNLKSNSKGFCGDVGQTLQCDITFQMSHLCLTKGSLVLAAPSEGFGTTPPVQSILDPADIGEQIYVHKFLSIDWTRTGQYQKCTRETYSLSIG